MIQIENLCQTFGGRRGATVEALREIDLTVDEGEFVAAIGRSGCGKSTLLRLIAGLIAPTSGQVTIAGTIVRRPLRDVGLMFQRPALLPWRSVLDNVLLPVEIFGWHRPTHRDFDSLDESARVHSAREGSVPAHTHALEGVEPTLQLDAQGTAEQHVVADLHVAIER